MVDFAEKLMTASRFSGGNGLNFSTKRALNVNAYTTSYLFRIGLWPIRSLTEPEIGLGIGLALAALLEQLTSVCVYRLMTQVNDTPLHFQWRIEDTQFDVDDWEIEGLDENIAIWGNFEIQNGVVTLLLNIENDANESDDILQLKYESASLVEILNQLPQIAAKIATEIDIAPYYPPPNHYAALNSLDLPLLKTFFKAIINWEIDYYLELWGQSRDADYIQKIQQDLVLATVNFDQDFCAWMITQTISRFIKYDQTSWSESLLPQVKEIAEALEKYPIATATLGTTLFQLNYKLEAFDLLESGLIQHSKESNLWIILGEMYEQLGDDLSAIDVYQRAIEGDAATDRIYLKYANVLESLVEHQIELKPTANRVSASGRPFMERYVLTDSLADSRTLRESCAAYRSAIELDASKNNETLSHLIFGLLSLNDPDAWSFCIQLVSNDKDGVFTSAIIERLDDNDMQRMINILENEVHQNKTQLSARLNLVRGYLAIGQHQKAKQQIVDISKMDMTDQTRYDLAKLRLMADDPDFTHQVSEIRDMLDAGNQVSSEDIEFLETAIEREPSFSEGYRLLAQSYLTWNEPDDALEVLLDGQKVAPHDMELIALLAKVLWNAEEFDLAFSCLETGLIFNEQNATLLSLMGRFLFDHGEDASTRDYLRRAEASDPLNPELAATRVYIANSLIKSNND